MSQPICPKCGRVMGKAGFGLSGYNDVQRWRCYPCKTVIQSRDFQGDPERTKIYLQRRALRIKRNQEVKNAEINSLQM